MAFNTIWSVDLGKSALKAVRLRRDRNSVEILAIDKVDYPVSTNGADSLDQAKEALGIFRARNEVRDPVVVAHPGQGTFSRFIKVPAFDPKKVKDMVRYEASQQIPFPLDEVIWDYHVVDRQYGQAEEREVGLFAVRKEAVDDYLLDFTKEGFSVEMLSIGYLGLLNFIKYDINPEEPAVVLDIGATHTDLILIDGERFWIRPLPHSGNDISKAIMQRFKLDFAQAEKLKIETAKAPKQAGKIFQAVIQPKLQELVQEVHRSIGYYKSQAGDVKFTKLYLLGNGSRIFGIKKFVEEHLGMPVERIQNIRNLRVSRDVNLNLLQSDLPAFGTALGCAIQGVGAGTCRVDLVPREEKIKKEVGRKKKHVFIAAGVLAAFIGAAFFMIQGKAARVDEALARSESQIKKLKEKQVREVIADQKKNIQFQKDQLERVAEARQGSVEGLRTLEKVLAAAAPKGAPPEVLVSAEDQASLDAARAAVEAKLAEGLWLAHLKVALVQYPESAQATRRTGPAAAKAAEAQQETVPAYKFTAFFMVKNRDSVEASTNVIRKRIQNAVKEALTVGELSKITDVRVNPKVETYPAIYFEGADQKGGIGDIPVQEGGPFFGSEVIWYMLPRHPAVPVKLVEAEVDTPKKAPKKPLKSPKKEEPK